jgi:hypothetical protein
LSESSGAFGKAVLVNRKRVERIALRVAGSWIAATGLLIVDWALRA